MTTDIFVPCPACNALNKFPSERLQQRPKCGRCDHDLLLDEPIELTDDNFQAQVFKGSLPIIVDFWASWCQPCIMMAPIFHTTAAGFRGRVRFGKLSTENAPRAAQEQAIRSIPTLALYANGQEVVRMAGAVQQSTLVDWIETHLPR